MTFQSGVSGNKNGRPKGTGARQQLYNALVAPHKDALINKAMELALGGNEAMLRLFLERMLPAKPKDEPITFDLPDLDSLSAESLLPLSLNVLKAASIGTATPEDCRNIAALIAAHHKGIGLEKDMRQLINDVEKFKNNFQQKR